jgi:hypothetical protein
MAVTNPPQAASTPSPWTDGDRAEDWFDDEIWHDYQICSNCFCRLKRGVDATVEQGTDGKMMDISESWRTGDAVLGEDLIDAPASAINASPKAEPRTTCMDCGSVRGLASSDAFTLGEALDRVPAIAARLRECGHLVDEDVMFDTVRYLKTDEDWTDNDKCIFATAAALGVKHG